MKYIQIHIYIYIRVLSLIGYYKILFYLFIYLFIDCLFAFSGAIPEAYGGSQARGLIRAVVASLCQSHSNTGFELSLQPIPQLTATPDP